MPGTNTLLMGPSGVGKTTTAVRCVLAALERGERATYFLFDEGLATFLARSAAFGMGLRPFLATGQLLISQIDAAELSPGEFSARVRTAAEQEGAGVVVIDSLNAYLHSMPGEQFLLLQMHEILTYLGQRGLVGEVRTDIDLSYLSDSALLFRYFEAEGNVRSAISVLKCRASPHERTIRELRLTSAGLRVGHALTDFEGVLTGLPAYKGAVAMLTNPAEPGPS